MSDSNLRGLYRQSIDERIQSLVDNGFLDNEVAARLREGKLLLPRTKADRMIENVIGVFGLPFGVAPNFLVNGREHVVPMVVEEPSIVAGVSGAAKRFRAGGGFNVVAEPAQLIGQIQLSNVDNPAETIRRLTSSKQALITTANEMQPNLVARGGGLRDIEVFEHALDKGESIVVLHLLVDTCDAMGANLVNTLCEALAPHVAEITGSRVGLRILSNLADRAVVKATGVIPLATLASNKQIAKTIRDDIVAANQFAIADPYRAATHNKGIMNGIDALAIATGNDWRAIEAGAHAFAVQSGTYRSLTEWMVSENGDLRGVLTIPLKPGTVGGSLLTNPGAKLGLTLSGVASANELAELMGATGLAQNFAALRALVSSGIQKGHMALHARSVAASANVPEALFNEVVEAMVASGEVKMWKAEQLTAEFSRHRDAVEADAQNSQLVEGRAAGKVILLGEHAVVYGRHALAIPIDNAIVARVVEQSSGVQLTIPDWHISQSWSTGDRDLKDAAAVVDLIIRKLGIMERGFSFDIQPRIPLGAGLGASAAFAVAVIRALDEFLSIGLSSVNVNELAFECEHITHGTPSGIDNYLATFARPILFNKNNEQTISDIEVPQQLPLVVAASDCRGETKMMVAGVRRRYESEKSLYSGLFDQMDQLAVAGAEALHQSDYAKLGALMNVSHGLLNALEVSTPELEQMVKIARSAGAVGAKLTGGGGGGSIIALCPGKVAEVRDALTDAGYRSIELVE